MVIILLLLILLAVLFPGFIRAMLLSMLLLIVFLCVMIAGNVNTQTPPASAIQPQQSKIKQDKVDPEKFYDYENKCVDQESAQHLDHGSIAIANQIADRCIERMLDRFYPGTTLQSVKDAEAGAPNGVITDLIGKVPGIGDVSMLQIRAAENLDCRSTHPGGIVIICNAPVDEEFIQEDWRQGGDVAGQSYGDFIEGWRKHSAQAALRRQRLQDLIH